MSKNISLKAAKAAREKVYATEEAIAVLTEALDLRPKIKAGELDMSREHREVLSNASQGILILLILSQGDQSVLRLVDRVKLNKSNVSRQLTALVNAGLVKIEKSDLDKRLKIASCTSDGWAIAKQAMNIYGEELSKPIALALGLLKDVFEDAFKAFCTTLTTSKATDQDKED